MQHAKMRNTEFQSENLEKIYHMRIWKYNIKVDLTEVWYEDGLN